MAYGAGQQSQIIAHQDVFPYWQYSATIDNRTRESHRILHGRIFKANDHEFFPPIGFRCRCTAIPLTEDEAEKETKQNPKNIVDNNDRKAFPALLKNAEFVGNKQEKFVNWLENYYYQQASPESKLLIEKGIKEIQGLIKRTKRNTIFSAPLKEQYKILHTFENGGSLKQHLNVDENKSDFQDLKNIATQYAKQGNNVEILPEIYKDETNLRDQIFPGYKLHPRNPDLKINNEYYEVEKTKVYTNIAKRISSAAKQADNAILIYDGGLINNRQKLIKLMFKEHTNLQTIQIIGNNKTEYYVR